MKEEKNNAYWSGEILKDGNNRNIIAKKTDNKTNEPKMLYEDKERRSGNIKHYKMSDGSWKAVITNEPMHYYNATEGKLRSIDNTLDLKSDIKDVNDFEGYENRYNDFKVRFAKDTGGSKLMRIAKDDYEINFGLIGKETNDLRVNDTKNFGGIRAVRAIVNNAQKVLAENNETSSNRNAESQIKYNDLVDNVDFEYTLRSDQIKENIIIKGRAESYEFAFRLLTKNVIPQCCNGGKTINFYPENSTETADKEIFSMPASFMYDKEGKVSNEITYEIQKVTDNEYILKIIPNSDWLNNSERVFPVVIDPTIIIKSTTNFTYRLVDNTSNYGADYAFYRPEAGFKRLGYFNGNALTPADAKALFGETLLFVGLNSASLFQKGRINSAKISLPIYLSQYRENSSGKFIVNGITSSASWMNGSVSWDNQPTYSKYEVIAVAGVKQNDAGASYIEFDITTALQSKFNGFVIQGDRSQDFFNGGWYNYIYVPQNGNNVGIVINYTDKDAISGGKSISQSCNRAGNGAIDLFTGNMIFAHDDLSLDGTQLPINISHVYNARYFNAEVDSTYMCGRGWRLNFLQEIRIVNAVTGAFPDAPDYKCYEYIDAAGKKHEISTRYYKNRTIDGKTYKIYGEYKENDGFMSEISDSTYTLTVEANNEIVLTDKEKNKLRFNSTGRLISIEKPETINNSSLKMTFAYSGNTITVTGGTGRKAYLNFTNGFLSTITYNNEVVLTFEYTPIMNSLKFLNKIIYGVSGTDNFTKFDYNSNGYLYKITDPTGYILEYKNDDDEHQIYNGYMLKTATEYITYNQNANSGIIAGLNIKTFEDITIDYKAVANNFWLFFNSMYTMENMTSVTNAVGAKHYYFNSDGSLQLEFDEDKNTVVNALTLNTKEINGCTVAEIVQKSATIMGTSGTVNSEAGYWNVISQHSYLQLQYISCGSYSFRSTGWYVFIAKATGVIAAGERFDTLDNAETTYVALKIEYTYKNGNTRVEFKQFDSSLSVVSKEQVASLPFYFDSDIYSKVELSVQGYLNPNDVNIDHWCVLKANKGTSATINEENDTVVLLNFNGKCNQQTVTDITTRSNGTKIANSTLPGANAVNSVVTYHNLYPNRVLSVANGFGLTQSYTYDDFGNIKSETVTDDAGDKMTKTYDYENVDTHLNKNAVSNVTDESGCTVNLQYSENGFLKRTTMPNGQSIDYAYNGIEGLLSEIKAVANENIGVNETANKIFYNKGYLTKMTHSGCEFLFEYDGFGRLINVYVGENRIISAAYTDIGNNIDGVTGAVSKTVVAYYDMPSQLATLCGKYLCGQAFVASYKAGSNNVYASYYDKRGMLLKVRHAIDVEPDYSFTAAADYVTVSEDNSNNKHTVSYTVGETRYTYEYDLDSGELISQTEYDGENLVLKLEATGKDNYGRISGVKYTIDNTEKQCYNYTYKSAYENIVKTVQLPNNKLSDITTDKFGRIKVRTIGVSNNGEEYFYKQNGAFTTPLVNRLEYRKSGSLQSSFKYTYDANNNITHIRNMQNTLLASYEYDGLNRLIRESIPNGYITVYKYDDDGNILHKKVYEYNAYIGFATTVLLNGSGGKTVNYGYATSGNKDRLVSYNGSASVPYDDYGNPKMWYKHGGEISQLTYALSWSNISRLSKITDTDSNAEYTYAYNDEGIRISKTANGTTHRYYVDGSRIIGENRTTGSTVDKLRYYYDAFGVCGFSCNGTDYYYQKNLQGDIIAIYDNNGVCKATYGYDAWGKCRIKTDIDGIGTLNPFRYRGYYYDNETELYYLQTRYYDSEVGRFISPDTLDYLDPESINGLNLYTYCGNNAVMYVDPSGHFFWFVMVGFLIGVAIGAYIGGSAAYDAASANGAEGWELFGWTLFGAFGGGIIGGVVGGLVGAGIGFLAPIIGGGIGMIAGGGAAAIVGGGAIAGGAALTATGLVIVGGGVIVGGATAIGNYTFMSDKADRFQPKDRRNNKVQNKEF